MTTTTAPKVIGGHRNAFLATTRADAWWQGWLLTALGLIGFFGYLTVRAFQGTYYVAGPYISPVTAPPLFGVAPEHMGDYPGAVPADASMFGWAFPEWWPSFIPMSAAFFVPGLALAFRFTCYYYRKAYYRAFAATPPACSVRGAPLKYRGETALLLFQNLHRYTLYAALFLLVILSYDALIAFFSGPGFSGSFGIGVGSVIMLLNAVFLGCYTFGCHSWRHLIGGRLDCFTCDSKPTLRYGLWKKSTWLNNRHMLFAWVSLFWVCFTDFYISMVSRGAITDWNTW